MRRFMIRMIVVTNEGPGRSTDGSADEEYYSDQEMPMQLAEWIDDALDDRDDGPHREWTEITLLEGKVSKGCCHESP